MYTILLGTKKRSAQTGQAGDQAHDLVPLDEHLAALEDRRRVPVSSYVRTDGRAIAAYRRRRVQRRPKP